METNTTEPIDIYGKAGVLERELDSTRRDERILPANRETICRFIRDARVGRTIKRGAKRRISETRCRKLLATLRRFAMEIDVPFEKVTVETMERFIIGMEDGQVHKLSKIGGTDRYRPGTILDFRKIIRKFYRWLLHDQPDRVDELTAWFDMSEEAPELKTFGLAQAERMAQAIGNPQGRDDRKRFPAKIATFRAARTRPSWLPMHTSNSLHNPCFRLKNDDLRL